MGTFSQFTCTLPLAGASAKSRVTREQAKRAFLLIPASQRKCVPSPGLLQEGMNVELEHRNVTHGDLRKTAMIAAAHLCEAGPRYYKELKKMERKLKGKR